MFLKTLTLDNDDIIEVRHTDRHEIRLLVGDKEREGYSYCTLLDKEDVERLISILKESII